MNTQDAKRVLETALICASQPMPLRDMRTLFNDELGPDTLRSLLDELTRDWDGRGVEGLAAARAGPGAGAVGRQRELAVGTVGREHGRPSCIRDG